MKIVQTCPYRLWPGNWGGARRVLSMAQALAALGHRVTLLSPDEQNPLGNDGNVAWASYRGGSGAAHFTNWHFRRLLARTLDRETDLLLAEFPYQAFMLVNRVRAMGLPLVYDAHNVEAVRFRQTHSAPVAFAVAQAERYLCHRAKAVLTVSADDRAACQAHHGVDSIVLPNGVDIHTFVPGPADPALLARYGLEGCDVVLFFGALDYKPNVDALRYFQRTWPAIQSARPNARLLIVGRYPPPWAQAIAGAVVAGPVEDIVAHLRLAHVIAVPLASGGGTRLKIVEALACGQHVLSTPAGAEGLDFEPCDGFHLVELDAFADSLAGLLETTREPGAATSARNLVAGFDWQTMVAAVDWERFARR